MASIDPTEVSPNSTNKELIKSATFTIHNGEFINLKDVVDTLKSKGYNVKNAVFAYYSPSERIFVYCGKESACESSQIPITEIQSRLTLKVRSASTSTQQGQPKGKPEKKDHSKRNKERPIGEIIEKVSEWRALYTGSQDSNGNIIKYSLEDAAKKVGIPKKTLDDYLLQLRAGKKYKFDFQTHKEDKVGVLRAFVKEAKQREKEGNPKSKPSEDSNERIFI